MRGKAGGGSHTDSVRLGRLNLDLDLWLRGWIAIQRIFLACLVGAAHAAYQYSLKIFFGEEVAQLHKLFLAMGEIALASLDGWLLVESVRIFLPPPWGIKLAVGEKARSLER